MFPPGWNNPQDRGFLWHISKGGHTSYLYGVVHVAKQDWIFPGRSVRAAFDASDRLAVEVNLGDRDIRARQDKSLSAPENHLPLPEPLFNRIRTFAERVCYSLPVRDKVFPEMELLALQVHVLRYDRLFYGIDDFLSRLAYNAHKPIVSLESPELRLQALRVGSAPDRISYATAIVDGLESSSREMALRMVNVWAESRFDELLRYKEWCECFNTDAQRRLWGQLIDDRNEIMARGIAFLHETGHNVFAAVGYAHMVGDGGLPSLLKRKGYQVEFVVFPKVL
jgi:uncharacterized protein YbaP (TraB family)